jgi:ribosomal protein S12 methylthiotransferase
VVAERFWLETLGCPKNQVDSDKLAGTLRRDGYEPARSPEDADLVVVNTCAFIEAARQESIDTILELSTARHEGARFVVTGCLAERHGDALSAALPEVDLVARFGVPVSLGRRAGGTRTDEGTGTDVGAAGEVLPSFDLLNLPRPAARAPWAYVKVAEGCDRHCGFCAIPSFRGLQRSRPAEVVLAEVGELGDGVHEVVLVAQDLASWGLDRSAPERVARRAGTPRPIVGLVRRLAQQVERVRLLYLYPSSLDDSLIDAVVSTGVPYFDLSLQHVSRPLLEGMRRWGDGAQFLERISTIRAAAPDAALRSSFILGYPGETEEDHDLLLAFLAEARLDWAGFFTFSEEPGTYAEGRPGAVPPELALERLRECAELQDALTAERRAALVGERVEVLVDEPGVARSHREAPDIDGVVHVAPGLGVGEFHEVLVTGAAGPDVWAEP